jgi:hypothetical protein
LSWGRSIRCSAIRRRTWSALGRSRPRRAWMRFSRSSAVWEGLLAGAVASQKPWNLAQLLV